MITRSFPNIISAYHGIVDELAYDSSVKVLKWGVCIGHPQPLCVEIEDILHDEEMSLGMASYTKSRWTRFLRRYFREDIGQWIVDSMEKLNRYPSRPFVASYDVQHDTKHNYGGCLSSLQIRISPEPRVILYSRACHVDKVGFLDLALLNVIARNMKVPEVKGTWVISLPYISGISQPFYCKMFKKSLEGHRLRSTIERVNLVPYEDIKFGPLKRGRKRMMALDEFGAVQNTILVKDLSILKGKFDVR